MPPAAMKLLREIDNSDNRMTAAEIYYVASLIDGEIENFTDKDFRKIRKLHRKRVVNGVADDD